MKKIIEIPDENVKQLKLIAIENDVSFKKLLQNIIFEYKDQYNKNELAHIIKEDGQPHRAIWNYLNDVYDEIKGHHFEIGGDNQLYAGAAHQIYGKTTFLNYMQSICEGMIENIKDMVNNDDDNYENEFEAYEDAS